MKTESETYLEKWSADGHPRSQLAKWEILDLLREIEKRGEALGDLGTAFGLLCGCLFIGLLNPEFLPAVVGLSAYAFFVIIPATFRYRSASRGILACTTCVDKALDRLRYKGIAQ